MLFVGPIVVLTMVLALTWIGESGRSILLPVGTMLAAAAIGALALGATLAIVALMLGRVLLLPIVGFVFVAVTVSVILQVGYFRLSSANRLLRRAPLHRNSELMGWSQMQVAQRFWLISMITGLLGVALALK